MKITISNIILLALACGFLVVGSNISATEIIEAKQIIPSSDIEKLTPSKNFTTEAQLISPSISPNEQIPFVPIDNATIIEAQNTAKSKHRNTMFYYLIFVVGLGGILSYILVSKSLNPLEDFEKSIKKMAPDRLSDKIKIPNANIEVENLVESFNQMTKKLEESFLLQKHFSQNVAHELRTPLTVMRTKIEVFEKKQNRSSDEYEKLVTVVSDYCNRLSEIVENILKHSNFEDFTLNEQIKIDEIIKEIIEQKTKEHTDPSVEFVYTPLHIELKGNKTLLYRVFDNLIENAYRYSSGNPKIVIESKQFENKNIIQIKDNGIGIKENDKSKVFEPFYRVDKSRSRKYGGSGLGLYFCKEVVEAHKGSISVTDNLPKGTIFAVTLPLTEI